MSSLLTNDSAMVALTTLRGINKNLSTVQAEVSTGKSVNSARDNAAIWAVSTVMQSDVDGFDSISESLGLASATVGVARSASESITDVLGQMKELIVAAQESNVDRTKIQTDIGNLRDQIDSIVNAAQFSGLNLLKGGGAVDFLASLDRGSDGTVTASDISTNKYDLSTTLQVVGSGAATITGAASSATIADAATETVDYTAAALTEGESFTVTVAGTDFEYVARDGDTMNDVVRQLASRIHGAIDGVTVAYSVVDDPETEDSFLSITNNTGASITLTEATASGGTAGGDLGALSTIDVTTDTGAVAALTDIEDLIQAGIDAAAAFGSAQKRVDIQSEFVTTLMDNMKVGIGALTDADMEEASARLQSLQVQQQLGIQALSIANQRPQALLSLFR
ncbi:MAG: flagellin [Parvularculaceae bacterium]